MRATFETLNRSDLSPFHKDSASLAQQISGGNAMTDPLPTTAARLAMLQVAIQRAALASTRNDCLRASLDSAAQWAAWANGGPPQDATICMVASLLDTTNQLIAEVDKRGILLALHNVRLTLIKVLAHLDETEPMEETQRSPDPAPPVA